VPFLIMGTNLRLERLIKQNARLNVSKPGAAFALATALLGAAALGISFCLSPIIAIAADANDGLRGLKTIRPLFTSDVFEGASDCAAQREKIETSASYILSNSRIRIDGGARDTLAISVLVTPIMRVGSARPYACAIAVMGILTVRGDYSVRSTGRKVVDTGITVWNLQWHGSSDPENVTRLAAEGAEDLAKRFIVDWSRANP
jgi:hypothetical protein